VWFQYRRPRRAWAASHDRRIGTLHIDPSHRLVTFAAQNGWRATYTAITDVKVGPRGFDVINIWVEVHARDAARPAVFYVADGAFLGWSGLVTRKNIRAARDLAQLIEPSTAP
jgi:hypothetical protein